MNSEDWWVELVTIHDEFSNGFIDRAVALKRLIGIGFNSEDAEDELSVMDAISFSRET